MNIAKATSLAVAGVLALTTHADACFFCRLGKCRQPVQPIVVAPPIGYRVFPPISPLGKCRQPVQPIVIAPPIGYPQVFPPIPPPDPIVGRRGEGPSNKDPKDDNVDPSHVDSGSAETPKVDSSGGTVPALTGVGRSPPDPRMSVPHTPKTDRSSLTTPVTTSHLSLVATFPKAAIQAQLEAAIPKNFPFDENHDFRTYGNPGRGPISVSIDPAARRLSASTSVSGKVQVEKRIVIDIPFIGRKEVGRPSVGIDVTGGIAASISPLIGPKWDVNPQLDVTASLNHASTKIPVVNKDVDITGLVRDKIGGVANGAKGTIESKLREVMNLRARAEKLWNQIASVHKLSDNPTSWLQIIPRHARASQFRYTLDSILASLGLDLEMRIFVQDKPPPVVKTPLPDLQVGGEPSDAFDLSLPVEVSHEEISNQLRAQLSKAPIALPGNASLTITDAKLSSDNNKPLMTLEFRASQGADRSATGRLFITGEAVVDPATDELRLRNLAFTNETKEFLKQDANWLGESDPLPRVSDSVLIRLGDALARAKKEANNQLTRLKTQLSNDFAVNMAVADLHVGHLAFSADRVFAVITVKGKFSATLNP